METEGISLGYVLGAGGRCVGVLGPMGLTAGCTGWMAVRAVDAAIVIAMADALHACPHPHPHPCVCF
jgi:hypothetical protein